MFRIFSVIWVYLLIFCCSTVLADTVDVNAVNRISGKDIKKNHFHIATNKSRKDNNNESKFSTNKLLKSYLELSNFRHKVLSQNIANANTPGYKADDVPNPTSHNQLLNGNAKIKTVKMLRTSEKHMIGNAGRNNGKFRAEKLSDPYEIKPNGNNVSIQQQMIKLSQNQQDYNLALKAYAASTNLVANVISTK